jgi:magnesium chelatase family protein
VLPAKKIIINLAPADIVKEGSHFDLPIAVCMLSIMGILPEDVLQAYIIMGELSLDASIAKVSGVLPASMMALEKEKGIICPKQNGEEAAWSGNMAILAPFHLLELINHLKGNQLLPRPTMAIQEKRFSYPDFADIQGQETAKRALEIAAAGGHNVLLSGPPGAGKSMLASRLTGILPNLSSKEILECSVIASIAGEIVGGQLCAKRPFRAPHHSCSMAAMVGGGAGRKVTPGEVTRAHRGVLFLDELPEFSREVLDSLRQPMETASVLISRSQAHIIYPARFQLIAAMNPCRCGYLGDRERECGRAPNCAVSYQSRISGPLLDRIDIYVELSPISMLDIDFGKRFGETSLQIARRVLAARDIQEIRYQQCDNIKSNSEADGDLLSDACKMSEEAKQLLNMSAEKMKLSMRGYVRVLRVSRTIADLAGEDKVAKHHVGEALAYRFVHIRNTQMTLA